MIVRMKTALAGLARSVPYNGLCDMPEDVAQRYIGTNQAVEDKPKRGEVVFAYAEVIGPDAEAEADAGLDTEPVQAGEAGAGLDAETVQASEAGADSGLKP